MSEKLSEGSEFPEIRGLGRHPGQMMIVGVEGGNVEAPWYCLMRQCVEISPEAAAAHLGLQKDHVQLPLFPSIQRDFTALQKELIREEVALRAKAIGPHACKEECIFVRQRRGLDNRGEE